VARSARLPLVLLVAAALLALTGCGGGKHAEQCPTKGKQVTFPLLNPAKPHTVNVETNLGTFAIRLLVKSSPCTTSSFASLVRKHFFDGTRFHRIVPGFVIQGGDPTGTGTGGPGYTVVDEPSIYTAYIRGTVAMAKTAAAPPGTAGSQFFIVTGRMASLPSDYAVLGEISRGMDVVQRIGRLGNPVTEKPTRRVIVRRMTITP
jgi:cyclophilin family peptidyl-prolyl cis-trans isomerase